MPKGPFKPGVDDTESSLYYAYFNTGKSITLDISIPQGGEIFKELVKESYVIIESFAPGQLKSWPGLRYTEGNQTRPYNAVDYTLRQSGPQRLECFIRPYS